MNETLTLSVPNPLRWFDAIPPDLRLLLGFALGGLVLYLWNENFTLGDLLTKLRLVLFPEKPPVPFPVPAPVSPDDPPLPVPPDDDLSIENMDEQNAHLVIQALAEWFASRKDEKGLLACVSLGQHLYSSMLEELKPAPPKPRSSGPAPPARTASMV